MLNVLFSNTEDNNNDFQLIYTYCEAIAESKRVAHNHITLNLYLSKVNGLCFEEQLIFDIPLCPGTCKSSTNR